MVCAGSVDDEYRWAGVEDPKIMITTARDPSSKLKQFAKVYWVESLEDVCRTLLSFYWLAFHTKT